jgi:hypothetical protein
MKLSIFMLLTIVVGVFSALVPQKAVIVTYPEDTPDHVLDKAMEAIEAAGGMITHEYKLIKFVVQRLLHGNVLTNYTEVSPQKRQPKYSNQYKPGETTITPSSRKTKWSKSRHKLSKLDRFLGVKLAGLFWVCGVKWMDAPMTVVTYSTKAPWCYVKWDGYGAGWVLGAPEGCKIYASKTTSLALL